MARCDDVTEMITVERMDSHEDAVRLGNVVMGVMCKRAEWKVAESVDSGGERRSFCRVSEIRCR